MFGIQTYSGVPNKRGGLSKRETVGKWAKCLKISKNWENLCEISNKRFFWLKNPKIGNCPSPFYSVLQSKRMVKAYYFVL